MNLKNIFKKRSKDDCAQTVTTIVPCAQGNAIPLSEVKDEVFSTGMMGKGFAVEPAAGEITAPVDATVEMLFPTKHAIGLKTAGGVELLIHIGINTVELNGEGFDCHVKVGDRIRQGDRLETVDLDLIKSKNYDPTIMMIVTNTDQFRVVEFEDNTLRVEK